MTKDELKKCMLDAVGNPGVGAVYEAADKMAQAVHDCLNPETKKTPKVEKETRIVEPEETR